MRSQILKTSAIVFGLVFFAACWQVREDSIPPTQAPASIENNPHLMLGNPSSATADPANSDNYLSIKRVGVYSYNDSRGSANWASWRTTKDDLGESLPRPDFEPDDALPRGFRRITTFDYVRSGYQRGHLIPSADRWGDIAINSETFLMTNIVPQEGDLNEFPWEKLERQARSWARGKFDVYTVAGVYGEQDRLRGKVAVPTNCWKVIVLVRRGQGIDSIDKNTRVIAVDMPNREGIANDGWEKYRTTVRAIEEKTGYDLLSSLPLELQEILETRIGTRSP